MSMSVHVVKRFNATHAGLAFKITLSLIFYTIKPLYSGHLWFLKNVSAITRYPLYRGAFQGEKHPVLIKSVRYDQLSTIYSMSAIERFDFICISLSKIETPDNSDFC